MTYNDTSCDIVVVGAGGAGLTAAVQAVSMEANVIVLEKQGIIGGNTNYATGGLNAAETSVQQKLGIIDSKKSHFDDTISGGHFLNDSSLVATLVNKVRIMILCVNWYIVPNFLSDKRLEFRKSEENSKELHLKIQSTSNHSTIFRGT